MEPEAVATAAMAAAIEQLNADDANDPELQELLRTIQSEKSVKPLTTKQADAASKQHGQTQDMIARLVQTRLSKQGSELK